MNPVFEWHVEVKKVGEPGIDRRSAEVGAERERSWLGWSKRGEMNGPQLFG